MREVADRDAHIFELERRLQDCSSEHEARRSEAQRRWLLAIPYARHVLRRKLTSSQGGDPA